MRVFDKAIPISTAVEWLEKGRTNLYALVDSGKMEVLRLGSMQTVQAMYNGKRNKSALHIMTYKDLKEFQRKAAPAPAPVVGVRLPAAPEKPVAAPTASSDGGVPDDFDSKVQAAVAAGQDGPRYDAPETQVTGLAAQLIQSIVQEKVKETLALHHRPLPNLTPRGQELLTKIRKLETEGLEVLAELDQYERKDDTWSNQGAVGFAQATMAMVRSLTEAAT